MNSKWSVVAVYRDDVARDLAVKFCDVLVQRFWPEKTFDLHWREWKELIDPAWAQLSRKTAQQADIIVVAVGEPGNLEQHIYQWLEGALANRSEREGMLVGLCTPDCAEKPEAAATQQYLRKLAHENGLDYLTTVPPSLSQGVPETLEACTRRATEVTSVLDTILNRSNPPPRLI